MRKFGLVFLLLVSLFVFACSSDDFEDNGIPEEAFINYEYPENVEFVSVDLINDVIKYDLIVIKPTPCHEVEHEAFFISDDVMEITVNLFDTGEICAQVMTPESLSGEINADSLPAEVRVIVD